MKTAQMQQAIEAAIAKYENAEFPGSWKVNSGEGYIQLVWSCDESDLPEMRGDEPWSDWGGDAILETAGIGDHDKSGCDEYQDKYGDQVVEQWAQWSVSDDDEGEHQQ